MSQGSSNPASPSRPVLASEQQETITLVSHVFGLSEVSASLEVLNIKVKKKPNMVHRAQTSYSPGASRTPWSPNMRDNRRSTPTSPRKPKRYALQIWLEVEVGPGYFVLPEDNSYSTDFTLEALNHAYPGCTGVYLDRGGHMLAFYGRKGSSKAGLIQEVAIEASHAVTEIPTRMGLTARWEVKCVSLAEANDILAGCRRLEQENQRRERQYYQDCLTSLHQHSGLSATAAPFQPRITPPPRLAEMASDQHKPGRSRPKAGLSPSRHSTTSSVGKVPSPIRGPYPQTSDDDTTSDVGLMDPSSQKKGEGAEATEVAEVVKAWIAPTPPDPLLLAEGEGKRKMGFLAKSKFRSLVEKKAIQAMSLMPSDSGLGASPTTGTTMRTLT